MAEPDRRIFGATHPDGSPVSSECKNLIAVCWTWCSSTDGAASRGANGVPPVVALRKGQLCRDLPHLSPRRIERLMKEAHASRWLHVLRCEDPDGVVQFRIGLVPPDLLYRSRSTDRSNAPTSSGDSDGSLRSNLTKSTDSRGSPPPIHEERSPRKRGADPREDPGISPDFGPPLTTNSLTIGSKLSSRLVCAFAGVARARTRDGVRPIDLALEIASWLVVPDGAAKIPPTRDGVSLLAARIAEGYDVEELLGILADAPELVRLNKQPASYYGRNMFRGGVLARWASAWRELQACRWSPEVDQPPAVQSEAAREVLDPDEVASLFASAARDLTGEGEET